MVHLSQLFLDRSTQPLRNVLQACVIDYGGSWFHHFPLIEFAYNNSYHFSIGMTPFEHCMVGGVVLLLGGLKLVKWRCLAQI